MYALLEERLEMLGECKLREEESERTKESKRRSSSADCAKHVCERECVPVCA